MPCGKGEKERQKAEQKRDGVSNGRAWLNELNDEQNPIHIATFCSEPFLGNKHSNICQGEKRIKIKQVREMIV